MKAGIGIVILGYVVFFICNMDMQTKRDAAVRNYQSLVRNYQSLKEDYDRLVAGRCRRCKNGIIEDGADVVKERDTCQRQYQLLLRDYNKIQSEYTNFVDRVVKEELATRSSLLELEAVLAKLKEYVVERFGVAPAP